MQKFKTTFESLRSMCKFIGQDVFADEFRRGKMFYVIVLLFSSILLFCSLDLIYTNDLAESIRLAQACLLIGTIQILLKFLLLVDLQALRPMVAFFEDIYRKNSQPTDKYYGISCRYARITELMFKIGAASYVFLVVFINLSSLIDSFSTMRPLLSIYFPFVHKYTILQLIFLDAINGTAGFFCASVMPACDLFFYLIVANFTMIPLVIAAQMDELSTKLQQRQVNASEIKRYWMHFILVHQKYIR